MKLRDKFWLWGHPEGCYNNEYGNTGISRMTPMEACLYLGVRNTFMVPVQRDVNRRQYNKSFKTLRQVGWEAFDMGGVEELVKEAADFPNIGCVVYDDFVGKNKKANLSSDSLHAVRERLHDNEVRPLDMWMVVGSAVLLLLSALAIGQRRITRFEGIIYLAVYVGYVFMLMK